MPTDAEQLATIKSQILANLVEITENPKPTYNIDGQHILWGDLFEKYTKQLAEINELLNAQSPYEHHSRGFS